MKKNCPDCGSSDALHVYKDHTYCFSCRKYTSLMTTKPSKEIRPLPTEVKVPLLDRGIGLEATKKYNVTYVEDTEAPFVHIYPYTQRGKHVANKLRARGVKDFRMEGDSTKLDLFGQSVFPAGCAPSITIVEGECDALAAYEMNGGYPVVSVRSASQALSDCKNNFEYLNSFDDIVICFDKDEAKKGPDGSTHYPGQEAALAVAGVFPIGKVRVLTLSEHKDPNEYLQAGKSKQFKKEWWAASKFTPAGIKLGTELWDVVINPPQHETIYYPFLTVEMVENLKNKYNITIISERYNRGLSAGYNELINTLNFDFAILYDCDSYPITQGWDAAMMDVIQHDNVKYLCLMFEICRREMIERGYHQWQYMNYEIWQPTQQLGTSRAFNLK